MRKIFDRLTSLVMVMLMVIQSCVPAITSFAKEEELDKRYVIQKLETLKQDTYANFSLNLATILDDKNLDTDTNVKFTLNATSTDSNIKLLVRKDFSLYDEGTFDKVEDVYKEFDRVDKSLKNQGLSLDVSVVQEGEKYRIKNNYVPQAGKEDFGSDYKVYSLKVVPTFDFDKQGLYNKLPENDKLSEEHNLQLAEQRRLQQDGEVPEPDKHNVTYIFDFKVDKSVDTKLTTIALNKDANNPLEVKQNADLFAAILNDKTYSVYQTEQLPAEVTSSIEHKKEVAKKKAEADAKAKAEADAKAKKEADEKAKKEADEKAKKDAKAKEEADAKAKQEADKLKAEAEAKAKQKGEAEAKAKQEQLAKEQAEAEAKKAAEEKAKKDLENKKLLGLVKDTEEKQEEEPIIKKKETKEEVKSEPATPQERKQKAEEFDKALQDRKEEIKKSEDKKDANNKEDNKKTTDKKEVSKETKGLLEGIKEFFGFSNLQKADRELKAILSVEANGLKEVQALLSSFEDKYHLTQEEQAKLMDDNKDAIKALIEKDADKNFRPQMLFANPVGSSPNDLENKKFTIRTRFDTSNINGPIQVGQYFTIDLDPRLTVKDATQLPNIVNDGKTLATPTYDSDNNKIKYTVVSPIAQNLQIPISIDVDYNVAKIKQLDGDSEKHTINNSITGMGVNPVKLPGVVVNNKGNVVQGITEHDGHQVLEIVEPGSNYKVNMDAHGYPVVKDGKLESIKWTVKFTSTKDLKDLGLSSNATLVEGSGLQNLENILLNGQEIKTGLSENEIKGKFGIIDSKNHTLQDSTKEVTYTFETKISHPQQKHILDLSVALNEIKKSGAVRLIYDAADAKTYIEDSTSRRVDMTNRTTILGEFSSDTKARWTVTDQVSTGDKVDGFPLATRQLVGKQTLTSSKMAVYGLDKETGKMVVKQGETDLNKQIPEKGTNLQGEQQHPGRIAVYEFNTNTTDSKDGFSLSGININKYQPIKIKQTWAGVDSTKIMPAQKIKVLDAKGDSLSDEIDVPEGAIGQTEREITLPAVKTWTVDSTGKETKIKPNIVQVLPADTTIGDKTYSYKEKYNYYSSDDRTYHIYNTMTESTNEKDANFTIVKTDSKDSKKKIAGAVFTLQSPREKITLTTDDNGQASFKNISPGTYSLTENKAPKGYKLDQTSKQITVSTDGKVNVAGKNISMQGGKIDTVLARHNYYPSYPSYMNAMHYGKIYDNGNIEFYIYLKPEENVNGGSTNKDTRLNLNLAGGTINSVEVIDVSPSKQYSGYNVRADVVSAMNNQTASNISGSNVINQKSDNVITGNANIRDGYTGKTGYQVKFPYQRFANDWGFLVKVKATGATPASSVSYDWLTDNSSVANEAKIQQSIGLSDASAQDDSTDPTNDGIRLNITNEAFPKAKVEVTKVDENGVDAITGATFALIDATTKKTISNAKTGYEGDKKGVVSFGEQAPGKYIIEESKAPTGYKKSNVVFDVDVSEDGKVTYKARFKDGNGTPINGVDYILEDVEIGQDVGKTKVTVVSQDMLLQEKQTQPDDGRLGWQEGIWEAYGIESYRYNGNYTIANATKGGKFKIQFDRNLDFKRYVYEIPNLKDGNGKVIAKPYFNYDTNLLTYVFEDDVKTEVNASIQIVGIIPDKYFATQTNKDTGYNFRIVVDPDDPQASKENKKILDLNVKTDYYTYDSQGGGGPLTSEYISDIYQGDDGNIYLKAVSYYNPTNMSSGQRTLRYDWLSMKKPKPGLANYKADGYPAFGFEDLKVYKVYGDQTRKQNLMPLSFGIRPEQDTSNYYRVYSKSGIDPKSGFSESGGDVRVTYMPERLKSYQGIIDDGHNNHPLEIQLPRVTNKEGYVIVQTFKVTDKQRFKDLWSAYYLSNGERHTGSYQKGNYNWAIGSETGKEIPKFYTQKIKLVNKKYQPGSFKIIKTSEADNSELQGAVFELKDSEGKQINRSSGFDGIVEFNGIEPGVYSLEEIKAPDKYTKSNRRWQVVVYDTGDVVIREIGGLGVELTGKDTIKLPVTNKPIGENFKIYKKDSKDKALPGARFKLTKQDDTSFNPITKESNENGIVEFEKLNPGTYIIEETEAPAGYKKLDKKWVLVIDAQGNKKVYNYREQSTGNKVGSILEKDNINWVDVKGRSLDGWNLNDNRATDWTGKFPTPFKLGTRIVGINKTDKYVIQRYVINPEALNLAKTSATIHREKPEYTNMDWYNGNARPGTDFQVFKLEKAVTGAISDIRLAEYNPKDITQDVTSDTDSSRYGQPPRLKLDFPATDKPLVVDVKVPYDAESGGIGTGMDWTENGITYWKSDYYERVNIIKESGSVIEQSTGIQGSYVSDNSLDVANEPKTFGFKIKKVKENDKNQAIQGAEFKLTGPGISEEGRFMTTGSDGMISFDKLKPGTYTLEETKPAPGYENSNVTWTVRITDEGKVYIKEDSSPTSLARSPRRSNANVTVPKAEGRPANKIRMYLARSARSIYGVNTGLELSPEIVNEALRAESDWKTVDPGNSDGRTDKAHTGNYMETKITEINKQDDRFRQIFLFQPGTKNFAGKIEIHREPESDLYLKLGTKEISNVKFYEVDATSTIDNITGKKAITINPRQDRKGGNGPMRIMATLQANKTILVEVETSYAANGSLGLGADYEFRNKSGPYDNTNKSWAGDSYANENGVNKNKEVVTYPINIKPTQNGTVTSDKSEAKQNEDVTITVKADPGYRLKQLYINRPGSDYTQAIYQGNGQMTFPMGNFRADVYAIFERDPNKAIISFNSNGGSGQMENVVVSKNQTYKIPDSKFTPPPGKEFRTWTIYGYQGEYPAGTDIRVINDYTFVAEWKNSTVNVTSIRVSSTNHKTDYKVGEQLDTSNLTIEATMSDGSRKTINVTPEMVSGFSSANEATNKPLTISYGGKTTTYYVNITKPQAKIYKINKVENIDNGSITVQAESEAGKPVKITVQPKPNFKLKSIKVTDQNGKNPVTVDANNTFTMPNYDVWINAEFEPDSQPQPKTHEITIYNDGLKTITVTPTKSASTKKVEKDERVDVSVKMESDKYVFNGIVVNNSDTGQSVNFVKTGPTSGYFIMPNANVSVIANHLYILQGHNPVNIGESQNGFVEADKVIAKPNEIVTLTPRPNEGYKLNSYTVTDASGNNITVTDNTFKMPSSAVNVSANFVPDGAPTPGKDEIEIPEGKFAQITNQQTGIELKIYKKSNADSPLIGAVFKLEKTNDDYSKVDNEFTVTAESDKDGKVKFVDKYGNTVKLQVGKYLLTETKSPAGYKKPAVPWKLEVKEEGGQLVIKESGPKYNSTSFLSSEGAKAGDNTNTNEKIKYKSVIKSIDPVNKTFVQRIYVDTRGYKGKVNVQITPTTKREEIDTPGAPPRTTQGGVKTAYRTTYKVANPEDNISPDDVLRDYDLRRSNVSVVNTARWRPFDWGFDEDQINLSNDGVYFIDIEGFYDDNIKDLGKIELKVDFYGGEWVFAQRTYENGQLGWKYDKDIGTTDGLQTKRDAAYQQGMQALYKYYSQLYGETKAKEWFDGNSDNKKYDVYLRKGATIAGNYYDAGRIVLESNLENSDIKNARPIQTSTTKADITGLYSSDTISSIPQEGMTITNEDETYNITFSKHAKLAKEGETEDYNNNRLEGAVFKLQKREGSFWYDLDESYVASAFNGYFGFRRLDPGRYRLLEVTPPQGYKPIEGPLLEFTIKQIDTRSGKIINPNTKKEVNLVDLTIVDPYNEEGIPLNTAKAKIKGDTSNTVYNFSDLVKSEKFNIDTCIILSNVKDDNGKPKEIPLKEANYLDPETKKPMGRIISGAQGYISLEYNPGGYVAEYGNAGSSGGSLVDYVTSATAKNMGKILNEKPGKGKVTIKKLDENGKALGEVKDKNGGVLTPGAKFQAIRTSGKKDKDGNPVADAVYPGTVDENGVLVIDGLPIGDYELKEVEAPKGHINTGQIWHFTVGGVGLDPYAGDIARTGQDLTSKISINKSELKVVRPDPNDAKETANEGNSIIRPHVGQSIEFDNEFKLDPNIEIKPGDYFVLKLSDNIDLVGIRTDKVGNLDLFADGVGTIAKADYDKEKGTITYTFTKYANQYKLLNFSNKMTTHINLEKVKSSGNQNVGVGLGDNKDNYKNIYVKYVVDTVGRSHGYNTINMASKIFHYNPKTGEFVHYFYVNRDRKYNEKDLYFTYKPSINVKDLQFTYYKLWDNSKDAVAENMPESFAVNENSRNLKYFGGMPPVNVKANETTKEQKIGTLDAYGPMIIKVTGKMDTKNLLSYKGIADIYNYNTFWSDRDGRYITEKYPGVSRTDWIFEFESTNTASADLTIQAVNPANKIQFMKVDPQGRTIKPELDASGNFITGDDNKIKGAAYFSLYKNGGTAEKPNTTWTPVGNPTPVNKEGIISYDKLEKGYYRLLESTAPAGYIKPTDPVSYFKVDESGKIYQKVTVPTQDSKSTQEIFEEVEGTIPIKIVNNKPIEFEKIDATDDTKKLEGAEFKVLYKDKPDGKYADHKVANAQGKMETMTVKSKKEGKFSLNLTKDGYYALEETKAPEGYAKMPGYIKEFKLEKGRVEVLEKDPSKASLTASQNGMLSSQILEVNKNDRTFKARLIINPEHKDFTYDNDSTELLISEKNWKIYPTDGFGGVIRYAQLEKGKNLDSLTSEDFNTRSIDGSTENLYSYYLHNLPENNADGDVTTTNALVIEFNGKFSENANLSEDLIFKIKDNSKEYGKLTYSFDMEKYSSGKGTYIDTKTPIKVENRKATFPLTGAMGIIGFLVIGGIMMAMAYYKYRRKRRESALS